MISTVSPIEAIWLLITLFASAVTAENLIDAGKDWRAVRHTGREREIQALANIRREAVRLVINGSLLVLVVPALTRPGDTPLSWGLIVIMAVPVGMALNSVLDRRLRRDIAQERVARRRIR